VGELKQEGQMVRQKKPQIPIPNETGSAAAQRIIEQKEGRA
jgi:hypothetical protein